MEIRVLELEEKLTLKDLTPGERFVLVGTAEAEYIRARSGIMFDEIAFYDQERNIAHVATPLELVMEVRRVTSTPPEALTFGDLKEQDLFRFKGDARIYRRISTPSGFQKLLNGRRTEQHDHDIVVTRVYGYFQETKGPEK